MRGFVFEQLGPFSWNLTVDFFFQESIKTKHPQLLYESKLYRILQGGSKDCKIFLINQFVSWDSSVHIWHCPNLVILCVQLASQTSDGLVLKGITMSWFLTCLDQVLKTFSTFAAGNSH